MNQLHQAHCGLFGIKEDHIQSFQSLDEKLIKQKSSTYFFEASGSSMSPLIFPKDILIVDRSLNADHNKVVVASVNGEFVCKRILKNQNKITLISENSTHKSIIINSDIDFSIFGVVTTIIRSI